MKEKNVSDAARKEMAKEKARIMRRKKRGVSLLEQVALAWKNREEEKKRGEQERRAQREQQTPVISVQKISAQAKASRSKTDDAMQWKQYRWREEERETKRLNAASIWCLAKKLIAGEWARALGRKTEDPQTLALEREATEYRRKKEEEKRRAEQERKRAEKQKEMLQNSLEAFGKELLEAKGSVTPEVAAKLLEGALESVGEIMEINWTKNGCEACIEPWEEKRLRRKRRDSSPVIYKVSINKMLKIVSYE